MSNDFREGMTANGTNLFMTEEGISLQQTNMSKDEVQQNIARIMDWIRGPGNKLLISQNRLPLSFEEADDIRKAHEQFEFKCMQALAMYARLRDPRDLDFTTADGIDQMEQSVKSFMQNLQRRRNVVVTCYTFFRLVKELRDLMGCTDQLAEMLEAAHDLDSAERCLARLNTTLKTLDTKYGLLARECERVRHLIDQIQVMQAVERSMDELREHLTATTEWLKLRALETKKTLQVLTCEKDARQGNAWLGELSARLVETYYSDCVGKTPVESGDRLEAHRRLETKAGEAHDYCKQLAHALVLMYRAAGREQAPVDDFVAETNALWQRLAHLMQETSERLEVADAFYRNVDILLSRVEQLLILISRDLDAGAPLKQVRSKYGRGRDELLGEFEETKNMGIALMERIGVALEEERPLEGVEAVARTNGVIKMKLYTLWLKMREFLLLLGQKLEISAWIERWEVIKIQIDRLYELMLRHEERWRLTERLPRTLVAAEEALAEHRRAWNDVTRLWEQVMRDLEPLVGGEAKDGREDEAVRAAAMQETERLRAKKMEWDAAWHQQKEELDHRHDLLVRLNDLEKEVDLRVELLDKCKDRSLGQERSVREADGQISHWLEDMPDLRRRVNEFFSEVRATVGDDFEPHSSRLRGKWDRYEADMDTFRWLVETALEVLAYLSRANQALQRAQAAAPQARSVSEIDAMLQELAAVTAEGRQLVKPDQILDASRRLYSSEQPVQPLLQRLGDIFLLIATVVEEITRCKAGLGEETIAAAHVVAVRSAPPPRPTVEMQAGDAKSGGQLELNLSFAGMQERPVVTWFKNGRPWEPRPPWRESWSAGHLRLWRPNAAPGDAGRYAAIVEDGSGGRIEANTEVVVMTPPAFARTMESSVEVQEGDPLLLQCQVTGEPEPRCEWFHQGDIISSRRDDLQVDNGDGVCAIKIPRVQPRHAGVYELRATSKAGEATVKATVVVQELVRPTMSEPLSANEECAEKETLRLAVSFDGSPAPDVIWYKDRLVINQTRRIKVETTNTSSTLTVKDLQASDSGLYAAVIKNQMGSERSTSQVTVRKPGYAPTLIRQASRELAVNEGSPATMEFIVSSEPTADVTWYKAGRVIRPGQDFQYLNPDEGLHQLVVRQAYLEDSGQYRAVAENIHGSKEVQFQLLVEPMSDGALTPAAPTVTDQMDETQTCSVGDRVFLRCRLGGHPPPLISWYKDDVKIENSEDRQMSSFGEEQRLVIPDAKPEDSGVYKLVASNAMGKIENECELRIVGSETDQMRTTLIFHNTVVKSPPEFVQLFRDEICKAGDTVVLQCQIIGLPAPTVWWSYNGEMLDESRCKFESQGERYSLIIPNVRPDDSGRYSITAENSSGVATCSSLVIVEEHGKTGAIERSTYSRSSSRPLSPLLSLPMPSHSQLSQLAPPVQIERVRTVEVSPGGSSRGDPEPASTRLFLERSQTSGSSLCGVVLNTLADVREQLSDRSSLSPGSIIVASQSTRQQAARPETRQRTIIVREYEQQQQQQPAAAATRGEPAGGRRQFGGGARSGSSIPVRIVRDLAGVKGSRPLTVSSSPAGGRYSLVESSEYDSD